MSTDIEDVGNERPWAAKVEALAGYGLSSADIACVLSVEEDVLKATYAHELKSSHLKANAKVAESLYLSQGHRRGQGVGDSCDLLAEDQSALERNLRAGTHRCPRVHHRQRYS